MKTSDIAAKDWDKKLSDDELLTRLAGLKASPRTPLPFSTTTWKLRSMTPPTASPVPWKIDFSTPPSDFGKLKWPRFGILKLTLGCPTTRLFAQMGASDCAIP